LLLLLFFFFFTSTSRGDYKNPTPNFIARSLLTFMWRLIRRRSLENFSLVLSPFLQSLATHISSFHRVHLTLIFNAFHWTQLYQIHARGRLSLSSLAPFLSLSASARECLRSAPACAHHPHPSPNYREEVIARLMLIGYPSGE